MDASGLIAILLILVSVSLWTLAFIQLNKYGGKKGIRQFFWMLITMFVLGILLFIFYVIPSVGCSGLLCGFDDALVFLIGCLSMLIGFPLIMITLLVSLFKRSSKK